MTTYKDSKGHGYLDPTPGDAHHNMVMQSILDHFGLVRGAHVLEVGAGSGRYTRMLLDRGIRVTAVEPDAYLADRFRNRFADEPGATLLQENLMDLECLPEDVGWLCGFHVLHHLEAVHFQQMLRLMDASAGLRGWFFLEPNGWNPLFLLQLALTPAMSFQEERGVWLHDYDKLMGRGGASLLRGSLGFFPPRPVIRWLPVWAQRFKTSLSPSRSLLATYCVYGETFT
jgi:SAM-dependent methyltransferase